MSTYVNSETSESLCEMVRDVSDDAMTVQPPNIKRVQTENSVESSRPAE